MVNKRNSFANNNVVKIDADYIRKYIKKRGTSIIQTSLDAGMGGSTLNGCLTKGEIKYEYLKAIGKVLNMKPYRCITSNKPVRTIAKSNQYTVQKEEKTEVKKETKKAPVKEVVKKEKEITKAQLEREVHKTEKPGKDELVVPVKDIGEKPLIVTLKTKSEFDELIEVQKQLVKAQLETRDAIRELVQELKGPAKAPVDYRDYRPKAYLNKTTATAKEAMEVKK